MGYNLNTIIIGNVEICKNKIIYQYSVEGEWKKYFTHEPFWIEYSEDINLVPKSVAAIPLLCNISPMAWINNAEIIIDELDKQFYNSIEHFKHGYISMYPNIDFKGKITVKNIIDNSYEYAQQSAAFFSGGVDAFSTLISHADEPLTLITIWGSDIPFDDKEGWGTVKESAIKTANDFGMKNLFIKSCFRVFLNEKELDNAVYNKANDHWWHGFQHGIGLIGHAAPYAFKHKLKSVYIASTFTKKDQGKVTCASDPSIDNHVRLSSCQVYHDGYQCTRQDKLHNICNYKSLHNKDINLRVCYKSRGGRNCCSCEKCYRTICGILAEGFLPKDFGLNFNDKTLFNIQNQLKHKIDLSNVVIPLWQDIQNRAIENKNKFPMNHNIQWLYGIDFLKINDYPMKKLKRFERKLRSYRNKIKGFFR